MDRSVASPQSRDVGIDVIRGLCIVSMATAHLAVHSMGWRITHAAVWIDGAVGFVFLSGLVLGLTQHRVVDGSGGKSAVVRLLRRTRLIYLGHLAICVVAIVIVAVDPVRATVYAGLDSLGGLGPAVGAVVLLRVNPWEASILSLYVVMMLLAVGGVVLLRGRLSFVLLGLSLMLYAAGTAWPGRFSFSYAPGVPSPVNWASWQLLFVLALCVGWNWTSSWMDIVRTSRAVVLGCFVIVALLAALAWVVTTGRPAVWRTVVGGFFGDATLGPGRIFMALAATVVMYRVSSWLVRYVPLVVSPLATIGRRSLDCYLILSVVVIAAPTVIVYSPSSVAANVVVLGVLILCWLWCSVKDARAELRASASSRRPVDDLQLSADPSH